MMHILEIIYSKPFFVGALFGLLIWKLYSRSKVKWQNMRHPLPNGMHYHVSPISRVWIAGLALVFSIGYNQLAVSKTQSETVNLAKDAARCWSESYKSAKAQININAENDNISRQQQELQREYDRATSSWLKDLVAPPGALANMDTNNPERRAWGLGITAEYQRKLIDLGAQFDDLVDQRKKLDSERIQHPLPEVTCGK